LSTYPCSTAAVPIGCIRSHTIRYRLMARRRGDRVRLFTHRGYRYPRTVAAMCNFNATSALIDGESVWRG